MPLFQKSVLNKYLASQNQQQILQQYQLYKSYFLNPAIQKNIIASKEEEFQEGFLRELFVKILGYTINPEPDFNLRTELKNQKDSKKADGAIIDGENVLAVIELKSTTTTDLNKIEIQAFNYKNNQKDCRYIITSNFQKLRFYIDNAIEYLEWDLFKLDAEQFNLLFLCLSKENIFANLPATIKAESITEEENVTKKLYREYSSFRKQLFNNIAEKNPLFDKLVLFKKTQKLLDRFLFLFFAEDRNLVPPNSVRLILEQWTELKEKFDEYQPLYERFKKYFGYLNNGYIGKQHEIFAYNGGLFVTDEILDAISIDDTILYNATLSLSRYDYNSDVDVNILGHIFEHSLTEIEELESAIIAGEETTVKTSKRKKDGVFYTPKYITKYIVENTVGSLCRQKKEELHLQEEDYHTLTKKERKKLNETLQQYKNWLLTITIVDPACGSGAFLNQALEYLIAEHNWIAELEAKIFNTPMVLTDVETNILENNLFGVDINEESVEIAKLSLWLRTARKGRKLNSLNNNIKCGNSLIDDPAIAGEKAFNWQHQFPHIFEKGGFDVVIGNPPYVFARENFSQIEKVFFTNEYSSAKYQVNTYLLFIEKTIQITKRNGAYGLIIPNSWLMVYSGEGLRKYVLDTSQIIQIINLSGHSFESANVETVIFIGRKREISNPSVVGVYLNEGTEIYYSHSKNQIEFKSNKECEFNVFTDNQAEIINAKLKLDTVALDNIVEIKAGLQAYEKGKGEPKQSEKDVIERPYDYNYKYDDKTYKYLDGKNVGRYNINWTGAYLRYGKHLAAPRTFDLFDGKKIIVREITGKFPKCIVSTYTEELFLYNRSNIGIVEKKGSIVSLKYILCLLNSSLLSYYFFRNTAKSVRKLFPKIILNDLRKFPIKLISTKDQQSFIGMADTILKNYEELSNQCVQFSKFVNAKFPNIIHNSKIDQFYKYSFLDLSKELSNQKIKLSLQEEAEWLTFFEQEKQKALTIKNEIEKADKEIDQMVYQLYGLTDEELKIVEGN